MKKYLVGADEVGRGCLFGPVVAAAVILGNNNNFDLKDSKKLSEKKRIMLLSKIERNAIKISIGIASVKEQLFKLWPGLLKSLELEKIKKFPKVKGRLEANGII